MATINISRDEAAKDFDGLIARAVNGDEIVIEQDSGPVAILQKSAKPRLLSESIRILTERGSAVTLDDEFEKDITEIINSRRDPLPDRWE